MLEFEPIFKNFTFNGKEIITVDCKESVNTITMHCAEIKIKSCSVIHNNVVQKAVTKTDEKKKNFQSLSKIKSKDVHLLKLNLLES